MTVVEANGTSFIYSTFTHGQGQEKEARERAYEDSQHSPWSARLATEERTSPSIYKIFPSPPPQKGDTRNDSRVQEFRRDCIEIASTFVYLRLNGSRCPKPFRFRSEQSTYSLLRVYTTVNGRSLASVHTSVLVLTASTFVRWSYPYLACKNRYTNDDPLQR